MHDRGRGAGHGTDGVGDGPAPTGAGPGGARAWNRTRSHAEPLADDGATVVDTAGEAVRGADAVITMLFDADATAAERAGRPAPDDVFFHRGPGYERLSGGAAYADVDRL